MPLVLTHQSYLQPLIEFAIIQTAAMQSSQNTFHYNDAIMSAMSSQITSLTIVYSSVYSGTIQRKHQNSASLVFVCVCVWWVGGLGGGVGGGLGGGVGGGLGGGVGGGGGGGVGGVGVGGVGGGGGGGWGGGGVGGWGGGGAGGGGGSPVTDEFPSQRVSYVENVSIWWRHHAELLPKDHLQSNIWPEDDVLLIVIVDGDGRA